MVFMCDKKRISYVLYSISFFDFDYVVARYLNDVFYRDDYSYANVTLMGLMSVRHSYDCP